MYISLYTVRDILIETNETVVVRYPVVHIKVAFNLADKDIRILVQPNTDEVGTTSILTLEEASDVKIAETAHHMCVMCQPEFNIPASTVLIGLLIQWSRINNPDS